MQAFFRRKGKGRGGVPEGVVTLGIVKKTEQEFAEWMAAEWGFLCGLASFDDEPLELEPYQIDFLRSRSRFRWVTSRSCSPSRR